MKKKKISDLRNILCIDPGKYTGWAYFDGTLQPYTEDTMACFKLTYGKGKIESQEHLIKVMWPQFNSLLNFHIDYGKTCYKKNPKVYIEQPEFWDSYKGTTSGTSGSLLLVAIVAHTYAVICAQKNIDFTLITANTWKGNLTKKATEERIYRINGTKYHTDHTCDAVGIGLSLDKDRWNLC